MSDDEPPSVLPLGQYSSRAFNSGCDVVNRSQSYFVWNSFGNAAGSLISSFRSRGPASTSATWTFGSALSLLARTQPAEPAPMIT